MPFTFQPFPYLGSSFLEPASVPFPSPDLNLSLQDESVRLVVAAIQAALFNQPEQSAPLCGLRRNLVLAQRAFISFPQESQVMRFAAG